MKFKITFTDIDIRDDGDDGLEGEGEIYYNLMVNNLIIAARDRDHPYGIGSGGRVPINRSVEIFLPDNAYDIGAYFTVSGWVAEQDGFLSGDDDRTETFSEPFGSSVGFGAGRDHSKLLKDYRRSLEVVVNWRIDNISVIPPWGSDTVPSGKEPGLKGVVVYEERNHNRDPQSPNPLARARYQTFGPGVFNLPYEPEFRRPGRFGGFGKVVGVRPRTIRSLKVGEGYYCELYDQPDGNGAKLEVGGSTKSLPEDWDKRAVSIGIFKTPIPR